MIIAKVLFNLYKIKNRIIRSIVRKLVRRLEGGDMYSTTLRRIFKQYHDIEVGMYTHGGCFAVGQVASRTSIGRYCSIARNIIIVNRNHPMDFKSMHGIFFNPALKHCDKYIVEDIPLKIGNDVWIGEYVVILAHVTEIGDGAVIGAGTVVNKNVPPYAVVVGNPPRIVRYRFSKEVIDELLASKWWEKDIDELKPYIKEFQQPYEELCHSRKGKIEGQNQTDELLEFRI
jgi:acetyltransferase-like isoleucine patch superfamily enzyme